MKKPIDVIETGQYVKPDEIDWDESVLYDSYKKQIEYIEYLENLIIGEAMSEVFNPED